MGNALWRNVARAEDISIAENVRSCLAGNSTLIHARTRNMAIIRREHGLNSAAAGLCRGFCVNSPNPTGNRLLLRHKHILTVKALRKL